MGFYKQWKLSPQLIAATLVLDGRVDSVFSPANKLRHQFEKVKCRKLSSDEKKLFKAYALEFFETRVNSEQNSSTHVEARAPIKKPTPSSAKTLELAKQLSKELNQSSQSPQIRFNRPSTSTSPVETVSLLSDHDASEILPQENSNTADGFGDDLDDSQSFTPKRPDPKEIKRAQHAATYDADISPSISGKPGSVITPSRRTINTTPSTSSSYRISAINQQPTGTPSTRQVSTPSHVQWRETAYPSTGLSAGPLSTPTTTVLAPSRGLDHATPSNGMPKSTTNLRAQKQEEAKKNSAATPPICIQTPTGPVEIRVVQHSSSTQPRKILPKDVQSAIDNVVNSGRPSRTIKVPAHFSGFVTNGKVVIRRTNEPSVTAATLSVISTAVSTTSTTTTTGSVHLKAIVPSQSAVAKALPPAITPVKTQVSLVPMKRTPVSKSAATYITTAPPSSRTRAPVSSTPLRNTINSAKPSPILPSPIPNPSAKSIQGSTTPKTLKPLLKASQLKSSLPAVTKNSQTPQSQSQSTSSQRSNFTRKSTARSPSEYESDSPRTEIKPNLKKRTIDELLSDEDDLMLPPVKKNNANAATVTQHNTFNASQSQASQNFSQSRLTLQDLLSSDEEDDDLPRQSVSRPNLTQQSQSHTAKQNGSITNQMNLGFPNKPSPRVGKSRHSDVIVSSDDDDDDLPEITLDSDDECDNIRRFPTQPSYSSQFSSMTTPHRIPGQSVRPLTNSSLQPAHSKSAGEAVQCPICWQFFLPSLIEAHASDCIIE